MFNALFKDIGAPISRYYVPKNGGESKFAVIVAEIIDLFIKNGYKITNDDLIESISNGCHINNIQNYVKTFDDKFWKASIKISYYPYTNIKLPINCLESECDRSGNIYIIKYLIKTFKLKPTIVCLQNACKYKANQATIKYLMVNHKLKPDIMCLKNIACVIGNSSLDIIVNNLSIGTINNDVVDDDKNDVNVDDVNVDDANVDDANEDDKIDNKENDEGNDKKDDKREDNIVPIKINKKAVFKIGKGKQKIKALISKLLLCDNEMTFIEARKKMIEYIKKNKLLHNNGSLIKINKELSVLLGIKENQYTEFTNINDIVMYMFD